MPAITADTLKLPGIPSIDRAGSVDREAVGVVTAPTTLEGVGSIPPTRSWPSRSLADAS
ncbi:MAG: hypothetical protein M3N32_11940 [Actinomycetota bacterium]|nr:hypothetical protein [Actinomycetota bacterium]